MLVQSFRGSLLMSPLEAQVVAPIMGRRGAEEHAAFVDAITARDAGKASSIMRKHLRHTADQVKQAPAPRRARQA
jgi:DNA-binding GntR family transcriptional regulator